MRLERGGGCREPWRCLKEYKIQGAMIHNIGKARERPGNGGTTNHAHHSDARTALVDRRGPLELELAALCSKVQAGRRRITPLFTTSGAWRYCAHGSRLLLLLVPASTCLPSDTHWIPSQCSDCAQLSQEGKQLSHCSSGGARSRASLVLQELKGQGLRHAPLLGYGCCDIPMGPFQTLLQSWQQLNNMFPDFRVGVFAPCLKQREKGDDNRCCEIHACTSGYDNLAYERLQNTTPENAMRLLENGRYCRMLVFVRDNKSHRKALAFFLCGQRADNHKPDLQSACQTAAAADAGAGGTAPGSLQTDRGRSPHRNDPDHAGKVAPGAGHWAPASPVLVRGHGPPSRP